MAAMQDTGKWVWCGLIAIMGLLGLFVAARGSENPIAYFGGIGFFIFAVLFIFWQIKLAFDHAEKAPH